MHVDHINNIALYKKSWNKICHLPRKLQVSRTRNNNNYLDFLSENPLNELHLFLMQTNLVVEKVAAEYQSSYEAIFSAEQIQIFLFCRRCKRNQVLCASIQNSSYCKIETKWLYSKIKVEIWKLQIFRLLNQIGGRKNPELK